MIKISLVVLAGLAACALLRRHSAAMRHWVLAAALACAAIAPVLELVVPAWGVPHAVVPSATPSAIAGISAIAGPDITVPNGSDAEGAEGPIQAPWAPGLWIVVLWIAGTLANLAVLAAGFGRLAWLAARATQIRDGLWARICEDVSRTLELRRPVVLLQSQHPTLLVTWGLLRPRVILPAGADEWPEDRIRIVLAHELAHVRRGDWAAQMLAEILRAVNWFNPLLWIAARRLRVESEHACDDEVLNLGVGGTDYAAHLLELARAASRHRRTGWPGFPAPAMVRPSSLERRVRAMLNTRLNRTPATRRGRSLATAGLLVLTLAVAGFGAAQTFATFSGAVVDPMNGAIPQATITLIHSQTQAKHEVFSDANGRFEFVGLPPGEYVLETRVPGFATLKGSLTVSGQNVERTLALQVGTVTESISIKGTRGATGAPEVQRVTGPVKRSPIPPCGAAGGTLKIGGNIRPPRKLKDVRPVYAQHLVDAGVKGTVVLAGRIGTDGMIEDFETVSSAHPDLTAAAIEAARQWEFDPTLLNCVAVAIPIRMTFTFSVD